MFKTSVECLRQESGDETYRWTVSDTDVDMSEAFLAHIFEPFVQERKNACGVCQGMGLGMSIVKSLLEKMRGTIWVRSKVGGGIDLCHHHSP